MDDARPPVDDQPPDSRVPRAAFQRATALGRITMQPETARRVAANAVAKGDVIGAARFAGVQAAKAAHDYLPITDSILVASVTIAVDVGDDFVDVRTQVESSNGPAAMPAITAATVALLTVYDMCKSADRTMAIGPVSLLEPD